MFQVISSIEVQPGDLCARSEAEVVARTWCHLSNRKRVVRSGTDMADDSCKVDPAEATPSKRFRADPLEEGTPTQEDCGAPADLFEVLNHIHVETSGGLEVCFLRTYNCCPHPLGNVHRGQQNTNSGEPGPP